MTKIYDIDGEEKTLAWMAQAYDGCEVLPARIPAGVTEYWQLAAVYCTVGPATLKVEVRRSATIPADNQPVVATWPELGNPSQDIPALPASPHNWAARGVIQRTEMSGLTGFGLSGGKERNEESDEVDEESRAVEAYGPWYHCWVLSSVPSDCLTKTGMKGGTNHEGPLHAVFVLTPVPVVYPTLEAALLAEGERHQVIQFNPAASLQGCIFADGFVPNSPEFPVVKDGVSYVAQRAEKLFDGQVRIYYAPVTNFNDVDFVVRPPSDKVT